MREKVLDDERMMTIITMMKTKSKGKGEVVIAFCCVCVSVCQTMAFLAIDCRDIDLFQTPNVPVQVGIIWHTKTRSGWYKKSFVRVKRLVKVGWSVFGDWGMFVSVGEVGESLTMWAMRG